MGSYRVAVLLALPLAVACSLVDLSDLQRSAVDAAPETSPPMLVVTAGPAKIVQGQQTSMNIRVTPPPTNGDSVTLSFTSLPVGVDVTTVPAVIVSGQSSVQVNLAATSTAAQGSRTVTVGAVSTNGTSAFTTFQLMVAGPPGYPDTTFGTGGSIDTMSGVYSDAAVQSTGQVIVCETGSGANVVRYNTDGTLDATFHTLTFTIPGQDCLVVHVCADDTIAIGDNTSGVWHLLADGTPDPSFGQKGDALIGGDAPVAIIDEPGALVISSGTEKIYRLLLDGKLDPGFATGGVWSTDASLNYIDLGSGGGIGLGVAHDLSAQSALVGIGITTTKAVIGPTVTTNEQTVQAYAIAGGDAGYYALDPKDGGLSLVTFENLANVFVSTSAVTLLGDAGIAPVGGALDGTHVLLCGNIGSRAVAVRVDPVLGVLDGTFGNAAPFASIAFGTLGSMQRCYVAGGELTMLGFDDGGRFMAARFWL